jgi:hypothetical protein
MDPVVDPKHRQAIENTMVLPTISKQYVRELLKRFKMDQCKSSTVPMQQNVQLFCDDGSKEVNGTMHRQMVGSLNYLTKKRHDISYSVSVLS